VRAGHPLVRRERARPCHREFIDNLLVRIHFVVVMIWWTGLAPWVRAGHPLFRRESARPCHTVQLTNPVRVCTRTRTRPGSISTSEKEG